MTEDPASPVRARSLRRRAASLAREVVIVVAIATVLSFALKTWVVQTYWIPSGSMRTTIVEDDRVAVTKLIPGLAPLARGDVVVFADPGGWVDGPVPQRPDVLLEPVTDALAWVGLLPNDEGTYLIKRVIGLPGDTVACCAPDGRLRVNGTPVSEPYVAAGEAPSRTPFDITVPPDRIWVMGDNRGHSGDSRAHETSLSPAGLQGAGASARADSSPAAPGATGVGADVGDHRARGRRPLAAGGI